MSADQTPRAAVPSIAWARSSGVGVIDAESMPRKQCDYPEYFALAIDNTTGGGIEARVRAVAERLVVRRHGETDSEYHQRVHDEAVTHFLSALGIPSTTTATEDGH